MKKIAHNVRSHQNRNMETKKECIYTTRRFHLKLMITLKQKKIIFQTTSLRVPRIRM
jgi:hypothetical protein